MDLTYNCILDPFVRKHITLYTNRVSNNFKSHNTERNAHNNVEISLFVLQVNNFFICKYETNASVHFHTNTPRDKTHLVFTPF